MHALNGGVSSRAFLEERLKFVRAACGEWTGEGLAGGAVEQLQGARVKVLQGVPKVLHVQCVLSPGVHLSAF